MIRRFDRGFTLLELLSAMGILVIIVMMMARIFADTTRMWNLGTKRVTEAQEARVIVDFLAREIGMAIADDMVSFKVHSEASSSNLSVRAYGDDTDSICFVTTPRTPPSVSRRSGNQHIYYVDYMTDPTNTTVQINEQHPDGPRYQLMRMRMTAAMVSFARWPVSNNDPDLNLPQSLRNLGVMNTAYRRKDWWLPDLWIFQTPEVVLDNVVAFEIWAESEFYPSNNQQNEGLNYNYDSTYVPDRSQVFDENANVRALGAPLWIDLYLEVAGEQDTAKLAELWRQNHADFDAFREQVVRRYSTRIYFRNREKMAP
jgi:prepilin-type N-terminal cleavage/methylation domain-containing protein